VKPDTFNLFIKAVEGNVGQYTVAAHDPGEASVTVHFAPDAEFDAKLLQLHARGADRVLKTIPDQDHVSAFIGERLFETFIRCGPRTSTAFDEFLAQHDPEAPQRIALHLARSLYRLPWELLRDPTAPVGDFLSLFHSVIRVDGEAKGSDPRYTRFPPTDPTLQLLFVRSSPSDRPIGDFEPAETGEVKFHRVDPATYSNFQQFTSNTNIRPDGFVFLGHGDVDKAENYGVLIFVRWEGIVFRTTASDPRPGYTIGTDLVNRKRLRFGCLMACETAWIDDKFPFERSVVGSILTRTKIPFVLGAQTPIALYAAREFLIGLVEALQNKEPLDFAVTSGRRRVHASPSVPGTYTALDWWVPVLYSKTTSFEVVTEWPSITIPTASKGF
jgi:hypothetical protein